ncbi:MAG: hypothetical protein WBA39_17265 [Rivularia sp. (in: cyanobacteria)]
MTMLFDIEQYRIPDSQNHKGDWDGVKYDSAWEDGSAFPNTTSKNYLKETKRSNKTDCWYSPVHIVELVIQVLGEINLDPCADDGRHIAAAKHYTFDDNGLEQPWLLIKPVVIMGRLMQKQYYLLIKPVVLKEEAVAKVRVEYTLWTITKNNGKQYQQAWYDWQLTFMINNF